MFLYTHCSVEAQLGWLLCSQGSVVVLFEVVYEKEVGESEALAPLIEAVKGGELGDGLKVDPDSVQLKSGGPRAGNGDTVLKCFHVLYWFKSWTGAATVKLWIALI